MKRSVNRMPAPKADVVPIINVSLVVVLTLMVISPFPVSYTHLTLPPNREV